jgi:hypothetical protein
VFVVKRFLFFPRQALEIFPPKIQAAEPPGKESDGQREGESTPANPSELS